MSERPIHEQKPFTTDRGETPFSHHLEERLAERDFSEESKDLKKAFEDFFKHVIQEKPDYLILLDKGARPFGIPFKKFLNDLRLPKQPKMIFWNDSEIKHGDLLTSPTINEEYDRHPELHGKKIFFVDETFARGAGASMLQNLFNERAVDGRYFAFTTASEELESQKQEREIQRDKRFIIYPISPHNGLTLFTQGVAQSYVVDSADTKIIDGPNRTIRRYSRTISEPPLNKLLAQTQNEIENDRKKAVDVKEKSDAAIYEVLSTIHKKDLGL